MQKILVVLLSRDAKFLRPFNLFGDIDTLVTRLQEESKKNMLVYSVYLYKEDKDFYIPHCTILNGKQYISSNYLLRY